MIPINKSFMKLVLEFGAIDKSTMNLLIRHGNDEWRYDPGSDALIEHEMEIFFPTKLQLILSGKNMTTDTLVGESGNIIKDKYIKLSLIEIDNIALPSDWLEKKIVLIDAECKHRTSNYFGHNGCCTIDFPKSNAFLQICSLNREV